MDGFIFGSELVCTLYLAQEYLLYLNGDIRTHFDTMLMNKSECSNKAVLTMQFKHLIACTLL